MSLFWQIRNRSFLYHKVKKTAGGDCFLDLSRSFHCITFNGDSLRTLFIHKLQISTHLDEVEQNEQITTKLTSAILDEILDEQLLKYATDKSMKINYLQKLKSILHQNGILYPASTSLTSRSAKSKCGYQIFDKTNFSRTVDIVSNSTGIYLDEKITVNSISHFDHRQEKTEIKNPDNTFLMHVQSRFHIKLGEKGNLFFRHSDLAIQYNSSIARQIFDKRSLLDKIKDFFKSILKLNQICDLSEDKKDTSQFKH